MKNLSKDEKVIVIGAAGVAVLYFGLLNPLLKWLGIKDDANTKQLDATANIPGSPWDPNKYKITSGAVILTRSAGERYAREIYDAFGAFNDCEECAIAVFKQLKYQTQVSYLSQVFYDLYNQDLFTFLRGGIWPQDRLSDSELAALDSYVKNLPVK